MHTSKSIGHPTLESTKTHPRWNTNIEIIELDEFQTGV